MIYGYCRVSSKKQLDGNGLEAQKQAILEKYKEAVIYEEQYTGSTTNRPVLDELISNLQEKDVLVVTKLDRLARNTIEGIKIVETLFEKGVSVHVLDQLGMLENTTMGRFFLTTLLAVAEMERNLIIERTQAGKEIAKQDPNFKDGRPPKFKREQRQHAINLLNEFYIDDNGESKKKYTVSQVSEMTGMSVATLHRLNREYKASQLDEV